MKRICQRCNVISQDFNLWCQEKYCPAENATEIFDNGEWFGPMEIVQPIVITRSAIVYQARRGDEEILLKVANVGCEEKLRLEARAFLQLAKAGQHPLLPVLLPAHAQGAVDHHPYGWTVIAGHIKYYEVFKFIDGTILRNLLLKNPQPWFQHAGWIILSIADVIYYLHKAGKLHLCLNPDMVLVRFDKQGYPRPVLLDLGVADPGQNIQDLWNENYNLPAYTAPEVAERRGGVGTATDVYGIGMLLYEMLAGRPAYEYHMRKDEAVLRAVLEGEFKTTGRIDLKNIPEIAEKSINPHYKTRFPDVLSLVAALKPNFPNIPAERRSFHVNWQIIFIILGSLLAISLLLAMALSLAGA
ncbi:MAG: protein kinase [Chloroflexi bacterium]|nr:protein kinase [Chloroflexota bacterium]